MAGELQQTIDRVKGKARILTQRYTLVKEQRDQARAAVAKMQKTVDEQERLIAQLQKRIEYLELVTSVCPTREQAARSRAILSGLVRKIDNCINELSE